MMKRLDLSEGTRRRTRWPPEEEGDVQLFSKRKPLRQMVVLVDSNLEPSDRSSPTDADEFDERHLLAEFLTSDLIRRYRYSDDGPPLDAATKTFLSEATVYPDWVVLDQSSTDESWGAIFVEDEGSYSVAAVIGNAPTIARSDTSTDAYAGRSPEAAASQRHADSLAAQVAAQALQADIYVTEREFLHKRGGYATKGTTVCTVKEALTVIGLYLRAQGRLLGPSQLQVQSRPLLLGRHAGAAAFCLAMVFRMRATFDRDERRLDDASRRLATPAFRSRSRGA